MNQEYSDTIVAFLRITWALAESNGSYWLSGSIPVYSHWWERRSNMGLRTEI